MSDFTVLSERAHTLLRPNMYIGSTALEKHSGIYSFKYQEKTFVPGLIKIINEVLDNCIDEYIRTQGKFANKISVAVEDQGVDGWRVSISDNGRGIPAVQHDGVYQAELAWTRARAGSNFTDDGRTTIGMNGVGSFATNCFSTSFEGDTYDGKNHVKVYCTNNCENVKTTIKKSTTASGTTVSFYPDLDRFGVKTITEDHLEVLRDRIVNLSICYPGVAFTFNGKKVDVKNKTQLAKAFHPDALSFEDDNSLFVIAPAGDDEEFRLLSYVNGLHIKNGGTHIDYFLNSIVAELQPMIKRKWKIEVLPNQIRQHILLASWVRNFPNPKFDSQTKERITNSGSEVKDFLKFDAAPIAKKIIGTPSIIDPMIAAILHKKELADKRAAAALAKKAQKKKIANHLQAQDPNPENRRLYITEGLSAIGSLINVRDSKRDGGYSLRGKVMNTNGMKPVDILKNKELAELMAVIGLDASSTTVSDLNYGKICIMTDADKDGDSIWCLLLQFFSRWPDLFKQGRICRVNTPLYIARKGKTEKWFYTQAEYEAADLKGYEINYFKGLGSLEEADYKKMIDNPNLTVVEWKGQAALEMAFGNNADLRKAWITSNE